MAGKYVLVYSPKPAKLTKYDKEALRIRVDKIIKSSEKLSKVVNSFDIT